MQNNFFKKNKRISFILCSFFPVGLEDYVTFFKKRFKKFYYLKWKFPHSNNSLKSETLFFKKNIILNKQSAFTPIYFKNKFLYFTFLPFNYFGYILEILKIQNLDKENNYKIFMGINYFCTLCGIILKKLGRVDFVIYRVMDFFPIPKTGPYRILNKVFHIIDKFCLDNSDSIWFTTEGHMIGREKYGYFNRKKYNYQIIPLGINPKNTIFKKYSNKISLVYCGVISKYHLFDLIIKVFEKLIVKYPNLILNIIGTGPDEIFYKNIIKNKKLDKNIIFHGYLKENYKFKNIMSYSTLGFALYKDEEDFMKYTEPAKVKYYLNYGVPALISDVPEIAKELDKLSVSILVKNNVEDIYSKIINYFDNINKQKFYKNQIKKYLKKIDINYLLNKNLEQLNFLNEK